MDDSEDTKIDRLFVLDGYGTQDILQMNRFGIKDVYQRVRGDIPTVECRPIICNNYGSLKRKFILYLAIEKRLQIKDSGTMDKYK